ncbi:transposable element Tcb1 transposase [Trichonephila clavipes]|nr:transposable element Tcb1 transposase [Trichonephila clavipes]
MPFLYCSEIRPLLFTESFLQRTDIKNLLMDALRTVQFELEERLINAIKRRKELENKIFSLETLLSKTDMETVDSRSDKQSRNYHTHLEEYANYRKPPDGADSTSQYDESVREGYIRNGGKEVKLFTSALKAFQCNNCIVMAKRKHLDDFLRGRIIGRLECGRTQLEVSEELGITQSVISRLWQQFQDDGHVSRCYSTGRPRDTTPNEDRYLAVTAKRNRWSTASDLSRQLFSATGTTVSRQTVYRHLGHIGLYARRPFRCVLPLTATHCCLRLIWNREHALWTDTTTVVLCDVF